MPWAPGPGGEEPDVVLAILAAVAMLAVFVGMPLLLWVMLT